MSSREPLVQWARRLPRMSDRQDRRRAVLARRATRAWLSAWALACLGCGTSTDAPSEVTARDSAGVRVVHNRVEAVDKSIARVALHPDVDIGAIDGASQTGPTFAWIAAVRETARGLLVVADNSASPLRIFSGDGELLASAGSLQGDGPGEFQSVGGAEFTGDTLIVWDPRLQRLSRFTLPDLVFVDTNQLSHPFLNPPQLLGLGPEGDLGFWYPVFDPGQTAFKAQHALLVRFSSRGELRDTLGSWPHGSLGQLPNRDMVGGPIFQPRSKAAVSGDGYVVGEGDKRGIEWLGDDGRPYRISTWPGPSLAVRRADRESFVQARLGLGEGGDRQAFNKLLRETPFSESFPAYDRLLIGTGGRVWIREYQRPHRVEPVSWLVVDSSGVLLGAVPVPPNFDIHEAGDSWLLGVERDDLDVEYVRRYSYEWDHK